MMQAAGCPLILVPSVKPLSFLTAVILTAHRPRETAPATPYQ